MNAYKKAFEISKGEIIFTLDSDDYFYPNKIKNILKYFENDVHLAFDLPTIIDGKKKMNLKNKSEEFRLSFFPFITQQSCMSVKRSVFADLIQKVDFKIFEDVWFDFRAGIYAKYTNKGPFIIDEHLTFYRISSTNVSYKFQHLSNLWWKRRLDYHNYVKLYCKKYNYDHSLNFDQILTNMVNIIYR